MQMLLSVSVYVKNICICIITNDYKSFLLPFTLLLCCMSVTICFLVVHFFDHALSKDIEMNLTECLNIQLRTIYTFMGLACSAS